MVLSVHGLHIISVNPFAFKESLSLDHIVTIKITKKCDCISITTEKYKHKFSSRSSEEIFMLLKHMTKNLEKKPKFSILSEMEPTTKKNNNNNNELKKLSSGTGLDQKEEKINLKLDDKGSPMKPPSLSRFTIEESGSPQVDDNNYVISFKSSEDISDIVGINEEDDEEEKEVKPMVKGSKELKTPEVLELVKRKLNRISSNNSEKKSSEGK